MRKSSTVVERNKVERGKPAGVGFGQALLDQDTSAWRRRCYSASQVGLRTGGR
jgi:hypothetical protein